MKKNYITIFILCALVFVAVEHGVKAGSVTTLNGEWKVKPAESPTTLPSDDNWGLMPVKTWETTPLVDGSRFNPKAYGKGTNWESKNPDVIHDLWYEKEITVPATAKNGRVVLDFKRIEGDAIIFLNNRKVSELLRPGGEVDVTEYVNWSGKNFLKIFLTRNYTGISRKFEEDLIRYIVRNNPQKIIPIAQWSLGITAPVNLIFRPQQAITDVYCQTSWRAKTLSVQVETDCKIDVPNALLHVDIVDANGKAVFSFDGNSGKISKGKSTVTLTQKWSDPICWELDNPYLYKAKVSLKSSGNVVDEYSEISFGFREIWAEGKELFINGHPMRWRLSGAYSINDKSLSLIRLIGYNVLQIQPHSGKWWRSWAETPLLDEALLSEMDKTGTGATVPAPACTGIKVLLKDEKVRQAYEKELQSYIRRYRNHPCIFSWVVNMNSCIDRFPISAQGMGLRDDTPNEDQTLVNTAVDLVKKIDPTRFGFSHADEGTGDIATTNQYLNFIPVQEREEWPMAWAKNGNMPYGAAEFGGMTIMEDFWKGDQFLMTEYIATYFGEDAYLKEGIKGLENMIAKNVVDSSNCIENHVDFSDYPLYWDLQSLYAKNIDRAWRSWGVNAGWNYWIIYNEYGTPPGAPDSFIRRYSKITERITNKPSWANPYFDILCQANQPLLAYIGGAPVHTDKTHAYYAGETVKKHIEVVWDGSKKRTFVARWNLKNGNETITSGEESITVDAGQIVHRPFSFQIPENISVRTEYSLELKLVEGKDVVATDAFAIQAFPPNGKLKLKSRYALYDPQNKSSAWLEKLGIAVTQWKEGDSLENIGVLILGRESLKPGSRLPYSQKDLDRGLRVLILEQKPDVWEGFGLETIEVMPRYVFARYKESSILQDIHPADLINWRGSPDLLPEGEQAREYDVLHAPKWTNRHTVASVAIKIPEAVGFTPILQTEFDLAYSPLLEWRTGKGLVMFSSLDFSGRVGVDPAATKLASNLLKSLDKENVFTRSVYYDGDDDGKKYLTRIFVGVNDGKLPKNGAGNLLIVGSGRKLSSGEINEFAQSGGTVFYLPQTSQSLASEGFKTTKKDLYRVNLPAPRDELCGIGANLLRWRDSLSVDAFQASGKSDDIVIESDGIFAFEKKGMGRKIYCQVSANMLSGRYDNEPKKKAGIQLSVIRLHQLLAQLLTNVGAEPATNLKERILVVSKPEAYKVLGNWHILGPYLNRPQGNMMVNIPYPGEEDAISGAGPQNPNITYPRSDGVLLDWRKTAQARPDGYIDLSEAFATKPLALGYASKTVTCEKAGIRRFRFGVDYWMKVWVNQKLVLDVTEGHGGPRASQFVLDIPLKQGNNVICVKAESGTGGFGFWADMRDDSELDKVSLLSEDAKKVKLYSYLFKIFDPYFYTYW